MSFARGLIYVKFRSAHMFFKLWNKSKSAVVVLCVRVGCICLNQMRTSAVSTVPIASTCEGRVDDDTQSAGVKVH